MAGCEERSLPNCSAIDENRGIATARGGKWEATTVRNILRHNPRRKLKASWLGRAPLLGMENIFAPRLDPERALKVFADPIEYAARSSIVVWYRTMRFTLSVPSSFGEPQRNALGCENHQKSRSLRR